ncbi:MAG TPA: glutathione S-transferase N-terminal domain-containing protein, partial [Burkholderiales bacterium]
MAIKLYDLAGAEEDRRFSPYCWRAKMALKHKGFDFETIPWRYHEKDVIKPFKSTTVPVLVDGNQAIPDS